MYKSNKSQTPNLHPKGKGKATFPVLDANGVSMDCTKMPIGANA